MIWRLLVLGVVMAVAGAGQSYVIKDKSGNVAITGTLRARESIGTKMRRLAAIAVNGNAWTNPPMVAPSAWQAATAYTVGTVVTNGGNNYVCSTAGTSAGSVGPSGTGNGPITDNTAVWYFYGISKPALNTSLAPTITVQAGGMVGGVNWLPTGSTIGGGVYGDWFLFAGGALNPNSGFNFTFPAANVGASSGNAGPHANNITWTATFYTDAPKFIVLGTGSAGYRFLVDGQYVSLSPTMITIGGNPVSMVLDFTTAGGRKTRLITVESGTNASFTGVQVDSASKVWKPSTDVLNVYFQGDSLTSGSNFGPFIAWDWPSQTAKMMGWLPRNIAVGGTGFLNAGTALTFLQRITDVTTACPDALVIAGGYNDANSGLQAAALAYFQAVRIGCPNTTMIVLGVWGATSGPSATILANEASISAAVTQFADINTYFVPVSTASPVWEDGTGNVVTPTGTGNSDAYSSNDGTHPIQRGIDYKAAKVTQALRALIQQIL